MGSRSDGTVPTAQGKYGTGWLSRLRLALASGGAFVWPLLGVILLILAYVVKTELFDRRRGAKKREPIVAETPHTTLGRQYARMTRALNRLGLPRRSSETPGEYAARAEAFLIAQERDLGVGLSASLVTDLSRAFARACYGNGTAAASESENWQSAVAQFEFAARRAWWIKLWRRVARRSPLPQFWGARQ